MKKATTTLILSLLAIALIAQIEEHQISIYPNPFADSVNYELTINYGDSLELELYDFQGRLQLSLEKQPFYKSQSVTMTSKPLNNGVYFTSALVGSTVQKSKIIKKGGTSNIQLKLEISVAPLPSDELTCYPNPTNSELHVIVKSTAKKVKLSLYDLEGKKLIGEKVENANGIIKWHLNLNNIENGVYIIHSKSKNGDISKRIVKGS